MKILQVLSLVTLLFTFTLAGLPIHLNEASAGRADGKLSLKYPRPAHQRLPNGQCIAKGTKKRTGIASYWNSQDTGENSDSDIHAKAKSYCRNHLKMIGLKQGIKLNHRQSFEDAYIAGATEFAGRSLLWETAIKSCVSWRYCPMRLMSATYNVGRQSSIEKIYLCYSTQQFCL